MLICALAISAALSADPLELYVREQLRQNRVPGASVVVIKANRIAWAKSFGVTNSVTRAPVTNDTAFPVASNGKAVTAWLAMRLIDVHQPCCSRRR